MSLPSSCAIESGSPGRAPGAPGASRERIAVREDGDVPAARPGPRMQPRGCITSLTPGTPSPGTCNSAPPGKWTKGAQAVRQLPDTALERSRRSRRWIVIAILFSKWFRAANGRGKSTEAAGDKRGPFREGVRFPAHEQTGSDHGVTDPHRKCPHELYVQPLRWEVSNGKIELSPERKSRAIVADWPQTRASATSGPRGRPQRGWPPAPERG